MTSRGQAGAEVDAGALRNRAAPDPTRRVGRLIVAVLVLIGLPATPVGATQPGEAGRIAFADGLGTEGEIATVAPDGSGLVYLTDNAVFDGDPAWSPHGDRLAFVRDRNATSRDLWVMNADGSDQMLLAAAPNDQRAASPAWSPAGDRIAFVAGGELWFTDLNGDVEHIETGVEADDVAWSPDGDTLAIAGEGNVWRVATDGSGLTKLAPGGDADWSPDGGRLVFLWVRGDGQVGTAIMDADGSNIGFVDGLVTGEPPGAMISVGFDPVWAPDGSEIVYIGLQGSGIAAIGPDGTGRRTVFDLTQTYDPDWQPLLPASGFADVLDTHLHASTIAWLGATGITRGCRPDIGFRFCPDAAVPRSQVAAFLVRAFGYPSSGVDAFGDDDGSIFEDDIDALAAAGVTKGCAPDRYCPQRLLTRAEAASMLVRALGLVEGAGDDVFDDDDGSIFEDDIDRLAAAGLTVGCAPARYCPQRPLTRGEFASFLYRARDLLP